jgi:hypothetical protein
MLGPNVKRLIAERAAQTMLDTREPADSAVVTMVHMIIDGTIARHVGDAAHWVKNVLAIARNAPGAGRWPTDEHMAAYMLRRIEERRKR